MTRAARQDPGWSPGPSSVLSARPVQVVVATAARSGVLGDHQAQVCGQVRTARRWQLAAEAPAAAGEASAAFVRPVFVEQCSQCRDYLRKFYACQIQRRIVVAALCSTDQIA